MKFGERNFESEHSRWSTGAIAFAILHCARRPLVDRSMDGHNSLHPGIHSSLHDAPPLSLSAGSSAGPGSAVPWKSRGCLETCKQAAAARTKVSLGLHSHSDHRGQATAQLRACRHVSTQQCAGVGRTIWSLNTMRIRAVRRNYLRFVSLLLCRAVYGSERRSGSGFLFLSSGPAAMAAAACGVL